MIRAIAALAAGAVAWEAVVLLMTLIGRLIWPAYSAVEAQRIFTLDMLLSRLAVGALATLVFGVVVTVVARKEKRIVRGILSLWLTFSIVDHYLVWDQFPVWYHLTYLAYIVPFVLLGERLVKGGK